MISSNAVEIRGLIKKFPTFKLGPLDLTVPRGSIYGLIGPNGAGKTTTIDLLLGIGKEDGGEIRACDRDHRKDAVAMKEQIGYVSPELSFHAWGRVRNAIQFVRGFYPNWDDEYCLQLMRALRVSPADHIATMSFGARIKLSLIIALSHRPDLLILDEPTVGLDAVSKEQIFSELLAAVKDGKRSILISSHGLTDMERFADHIGMIKNGKMLVEGSTDEVVGRFRLIDYELHEEPSQITSTIGFFVLNQSPGRCRVLVDQSRTAPPAEFSRGMREISNTPVSLEELFIGLAKQEAL